MFNNLWIEKHRPQILEDMVLEPSVQEYFEGVKKSGEIPHLLLCSGAGSGKTSLAKIIPKILNVSYRYINASDERGIDTIREKVVNFAQTKSIDGKFKIIILDEMDGLTGDAQRALRNTMEEYSSNARFILTANYKNRVIKPIISRVQLFEIVPPLEGCVKRVVDIIKKENVTVPLEQKDKLRNLISACYPDLRRTIGSVQQNVKDNVLNIREIKDVTEIATKLWKKIKEKVDSTDLRKFTIENEIEFGNDYQVLLKNLFEVVYSDTFTFLKEDQKRQALLVIGNALYKHQFVLDFEINAYCCLLELQSIF